MPSGVSAGTQSSALVSIIDNDPFFNVCDRTEEVQAAIITAANALSGVTVTGCEEITEAHLGAITSLRIAVTEVAELQFGDFSGLGSLEDLDISSNDNLRTLPSGLFADLDMLEELDLQNNSLESLRSDVFSGLDRLRNIILDDNDLTTLRSDVFSGLFSLEDLSLRRNVLESLPPDVFSGLGSLRRLFVTGNTKDNNVLESLPPDVFSGLDSLINLELHNNGLTSLPPDVFSGLGSLINLSLSDNALTSLPPDVFSDLGMLAELHLNDNALTSLPPGLISAELEARLRVLGLSNNPWASPLSVSDERVFEDDGTASVTVELLRDLDYDLELSVSTVDVTAESGSDYVALSNVLLGIGSEDAVNRRHSRQI